MLAIWPVSKPASPRPPASVSLRATNLLQHQQLTQRSQPQGSPEVDGYRDRHGGGGGGGGGESFGMWNQGRRELSQAYYPICRRRRKSCLDAMADSTERQCGLTDDTRVTEWSWMDTLTARLTQDRVGIESVPPPPPPPPFRSYRDFVRRLAASEPTIRPNEVSSSWVIIPMFNVALRPQKPTICDGREAHLDFHNSSWSPQSAEAVNGWGGRERVCV